MKIKSVTISNILSFAPQTAPPAPTLTLQSTGNEGSLHILIGPNGAGKSNFIEILNNCFRRALFLPVVFNEQNLMAERIGSVIGEGDRRQTLLVQSDQIPWNLAPHHGATTEQQTVTFDLELNNNDFQNIDFLLANAGPINQILNRYSAFENLVQVVDGTAIRGHSNIQVSISYNRNQPLATVSLLSQDDPSVGFIKSYLLYFRVFQEAIKIYNRYQRPLGQPEWPILKETFALLGSYRNYAAINNAISVESNRSFQQINQRLRDESTRSGGGEEPAVFDLVRRKIGYAFYDIHHDYGIDESITRLYNEQPLLNINKLLAKYLNLEIKVVKPNDIDPGLQMHFERDGQRIETSELSSGEKGILHFIFILYGFDLENGVIVIDEPELHLHPQIQHEYQSLLEEVRKEFDIQFIIATHSPIFVNERSISHVYRCVRRSGHTEIINPIITAPQKSLIKILDLTNSAKIFFVNKAILVEGETDEYFLNFLLKYLRASADDTAALPWQKQIDDFEIFNVKGKGARNVWTEFLQKFGLQVFFIGDWDNITETTSFDLTKYTAEYQRALAAAGSTIQQKGSVDGAALFAAIDKVISTPDATNLLELAQLKDYIAARVTKYPALIRHIQSTDPTEWTRLETAISDSYARKIFILKQGELEDYLGLGSKGIEHVVKFCENDFNSWLTSSSCASYRDEILNILEEIFS
jgi:ABC-type uncharacterized transport system ATPase subunit